MFSSESLSKIKGKELPQDYCCPITLEIMADPVMAADGHSYERSAIVTWLTNHNTSPSTGEELEHKQVIANRTLKKAIQTFVEENKTMFQKKFIEAMEEDNYSVILHLEKLGVDIKTLIDGNGWTYLHHSVYKQNEQKVLFCLQKNIDINKSSANNTIGSSLLCPIDVNENIKNLENKISQLNEEMKNNIQAISYETTHFDFGWLEKKIKRNIYQTNINDLTKRIEWCEIEIKRQQRSGERNKDFEADIANVKSELYALRSAENCIKHFNGKILSHKSLINIINNGFSFSSKNFTALHLAIYLSSFKIVNILLDNGADIEAGDYTKATPLFWAVYINNDESMKFLIQKGANVEAKDNEGNTLLHASAKYADKNIIEYLLSIGLNYQIKNNSGQTPANIATSYGRKEIANYIEVEGEKIWQNIPRRLVEQNKRIISLEEKVNSLQEKFSIFLKNNQNTASSNSFTYTSESSATISAKLGVFNKTETASSNEAVNDSNETNNEKMKFKNH